MLTRKRLLFTKSRLYFYQEGSTAEEESAFSVFARAWCLLLWHTVHWLKHFTWLRPGPRGQEAQSSFVPRRKQNRVWVNCSQLYSLYSLSSLNSVLSSLPSHFCFHNGTESPVNDTIAKPCGKFLKQVSWGKINTNKLYTTTVHILTHFNLCWFAKKLLSKVSYAFCNPYYTHPGPLLPGNHFYFY